MSVATEASATEPQTGDFIRIVGARTHNLRNINVDIPRNQLVVVTGLSGSGKSSLAFNTLFSEGQRQYIESLSVFSRQFFNQMQRADVDIIEGLQPTLCLDQRNSVTNSRSTVATVTEIYDFLRVLMARAGDIHCFQCHEPIRQQTVQQIADWLLNLPDETKVMILSPIVSGRRGKHEETFQLIRKERLVRLRINGELHDIDRLPEINARKNHTIEAITDRIIIRDGIETRLIEAIELATRLSDGLIVATYKYPASEEPSSDWEERLFSTQYACTKCDINYAEIQPRTFSFNSPYGACENCDGLGEFVQFDPGLVLPDRTKSICNGAVAAWNGLTKSAIKKRITDLVPVLKAMKFDAKWPLSKLADDDWNQFLHSEKKDRLGLIVQLEKELATTPSVERQEILEAFLASNACSVCQGSRLSAQANAVTLEGHNIGSITKMPISNAEQFFASLEFEGDRKLVADVLVPEILSRLRFLLKVGVHYLTLGRPANTLSGGEFQRVRLATSIGSGLTGVCYVLDEPSIGLHQRDNDRLIETIRELQAAGNTVVVVEHDEAMIRTADHVIDMGPEAGANGGEILASGPPESLASCPESLTGKYLSGELSIPVPAQRRVPDLAKQLSIIGASGNNLRNVDAHIPLGLLICVTGVSGSGKSTLVYETLAPAICSSLGLVTPRPLPFQTVTGVEAIDKIIRVDQKPIGRTSRGCVATYCGLMDELRKVFSATRLAKQRGFSASRFSFNSKSGWCPDCQGLGQRKITMNFLPDMFVPCETCRGQRYNLQTLGIRFKELTIAETLELSVDQALEHFAGFEKMRVILQSLHDVGLGYLKLGQPSTTFSGGEAQRIKLATELSQKNSGATVYLLDEPTTGLHFHDVRSLLSVLNQLVDAGNTAIVIEHNLDVIKCADWIIDMGPEGGLEGGQIVVTGTPEQVAGNSASLTGRCLANLL